VKPLAVDPYLTVYMLLSQNGTYLATWGYDSGANLGGGFFLTRESAEHARTKELLTQSSENKTQYHIYEIEIPNPAYQL
jgi:hypothetical protein